MHQPTKQALSPSTVSYLTSHFCIRKCRHFEKKPSPKIHEILLRGSECVLQGPKVPELSSSLRILSLTSSSHCWRIWTASSMEQLSRRMLSMAKSLSPNSRVPVLDKKIRTFRTGYHADGAYTHIHFIILVTTSSSHKDKFPKHFGSMTNAA